MFQQDRLSSSSIHLLPFPFTLQAHVFLSFSWAAIVSILYPPKKMYRYYKVTKNLINVQSLCGRHLRQKLASCFLGMTVHVCHSLLYTYIYMFQIGIICISTDCRHFELALEMMKCWLFQWPPMATYIFKLSSLSFSSTEKQYCSTMMIDYWKVAVISDCLQSPVNTKQWMGIFWHVKKNNNEKKREQTWYPTASKHFQLARQIKFQSHKSCFN